MLPEMFFVFCSWDRLDVFLLSRSSEAREVALPRLVHKSQRADCSVFPFATLDLASSQASLWKKVQPLAMAFSHSEGGGRDAGAECQAIQRRERGRNDLAGDDGPDIHIGSATIRKLAQHKALLKVLRGESVPDSPVDT